MNSDGDALQNGNLVFGQAVNTGVENKIVIWSLCTENTACPTEANPRCEFDECGPCLEAIDCVDFPATPACTFASGECTAVPEVSIVASPSNVCSED
mmetsp:Transcript_28755/g.25874  ORF Transcript_28755/g.25874 Transcript_28755/m.25874 type:complete len:97 (+) Transcript_28755:158-448(+)